MLRVASYNIHAGYGTDGRQDIERIAAVIEEIAPDAIGLQEVESRRSRARLDQAERLAVRLGMICVEGPILLEGRGWYGNAILTRLPVRTVERVQFTAHGGEPRGALDVTLGAGTDGRHWRIVNTHLDLRARARLGQARELARLLRSRSGGHGLLIGDFNEWWPWGRTLAVLAGLGVMLPAPATYPSWWPLLALDRIILLACGLHGRLWRHRTALSRRASDHLPVVADITAEAPA